MRISPILFFLISAAILTMGCATSGIVTDFNKRSTTLTDMKVEGNQRLRIYEGSAIRELKLSKIKSISIQADETRMLNRELYCLAEIVLLDGTAIGSFDEGKPKAYIAGSQYIYGKDQHGAYRIIISDIARIECNTK